MIWICSIEIIDPQVYGMVNHSQGLLFVDPCDIMANQGKAHASESKIGNSDAGSAKSPVVHSHIGTQNNH